MSDRIAYAGIGSRKTPAPLLRTMHWMAGRIAHCNIILRTGGARGADTAFIDGARAAGAPDSLVEVYRPRDALEPWGSWSLPTVARYHPNPQALSYSGTLLMARNAMQVLGPRGDDPVQFVVCWTPEGKGGGGTGQGIRIARDYDIPVYDLAVCNISDIPIMRRCDTRYGNRRRWP